MVGTKKSLGQHWLKNRAILDEIANLAAEGSAYDSSEKNNEKIGLCLEIGPGLGTLTSSLLKRFDKVVAVEYDDRLANNLPKSFPGKNLEVINEDFLQFDLDGFAADDKINYKKYVIAGNIPYYITSPIIEKILSVKRRPERVVLLVQREVAERIADEKQTMLSLIVNNWAEVELGSVVTREQFTPPPKVDSRIIVLKPREEPRVAEEVFKVIKVGFRAPRKKLIHNLVSLKSREDLSKIFIKSGIDLSARPGDLDLADWEKLYLELA